MPVSWSSYGPKCQYRSNDDSKNWFDVHGSIAASVRVALALFARRTARGIMAIFVLAKAFVKSSIGSLSVVVTIGATRSSAFVSSTRSRIVVGSR